ncbi:hypothetical protein SAMN02800694_0728 [Luteibacter sp. UNCMF331Sha3.1]|uniref:DUF4398 domain-containing protein n=1 Tax=Luteibacter sp. UNCMF331Sha3.1 TaxID=1502760 RepID=UPI0008CDCB35|nr:DUF4398 domain-containing protein [Luteibacter sp. UNCMF331Sha3.1]SEM34672.1 hypothetical protein SAMN02800694_0728 [Luteibacter sp. UNCMF331Sha3.1]
MKRSTILLSALALAVSAGNALAATDDLDVRRLNSSLDQLSSDPVLGGYAQGEQARAREAISQVGQYKPKDKLHAHYLYIAERRVDTAKAVAQFQDAQAKSAQLDREHDGILLESSRLDAEMARRQLEQQRMQNQMIQEEAARLQQQGVEYSQALEQAKAEGDKARQVAAAQAKVANAAKKQAALAEAAARAMRDINSSDGGAPASTPATTPKKSKKSGGN